MSAAGAKAPPVTTPSGSSTPSNSTSQAPANHEGSCDLTGRWIFTSHLVVDALGEPQYAHYYQYFELEQQGTTFTTKKGLLCDSDSVGTGVFAASSSFATARAAVADRVKYEGRAGSSTSVDGGCQVKFDKWYTVIGATSPYYLDPSVPLPSANEMASGDKPGWEDWDGDGNPGITGVVSGIVTGKIFVAPRMWISINTVVPDVTTAPKLITEWNSEQNVMAYDGTDLLSSQAVRGADASKHFTQMARLADDQAVGDNAAICKSVLALAKTLTPEAAGN